MLLQYLILYCIAPIVVSAARVELGSTMVIGAEFSNVEFFGNIPFAKAPTGALRLSPPVLQTSLSGSEFQATSFGPGCLQPASSANQVSEDCLTLNIFRPADTDKHDKLPVMVWIYGGGFFSGQSSLYNGTNIVTRSVDRGTPVIYANLDYRLGPLGFPQGSETNVQRAANLGLKDQLAALQWINANIEAFGGDKNKESSSYTVTVFGESAGATSISLHLLGSEISKVVRSAIIQSSVWAPIYGPERNEAAWQDFVASVPSCSGAAAGSSNVFECLKNVDSSTILQAIEALAAKGSLSAFQPSIDGVGGLIPDFPSRLLPVTRVSTLIGTNLDEGTVFVPQDTNSTEEIRQSLIMRTTPSVVSSQQLMQAVDEVLILYPDVPSLGSPFGTGNATFGLSSQFKRFAAISGDLLLQSFRRMYSQNTSKRGGKVFAYLFTDLNGPVPAGLLPNPLAPSSLGATHGTELGFVYGTLQGNVSAPALTLSTIMRDYWISFASGLDPNDGYGSRRPLWRQYEVKDEILMQLNGENTTLIPDDYRVQQLQFFNDNPLIFHR